jgi:predicted transport protein
MAMNLLETRRAIISDLPGKTGHDLTYWIGLLETYGPARGEERVLWLKEKHRLGHWQAQTIVYESEKREDHRALSDEKLADAQYAGDKAHLEPIYDRLVRAARNLGGDVGIQPRKTYVSLIRERQFAIIQASTRTRVDLGLALPGRKSRGRLKNAGNLGSDRITHKVSLAHPQEVDEEVIGWLKEAYEKDL